MANCICETCVNLKDIRLENGEEATSCAFGALSDMCSDCNEAGCEATCDYFQAINDAIEPAVITVACSVCGKELQLIGDDKEEGAVFCVTCYLAREGESD